jgi:site-specific DNA-methyltransferase (adenine-specific)
MNPVRIGDATLYLGDCMEVLPTLPKVDAVITDPPYGINKAVWDSEVPIEWFRHALDKLDSSGGAYVFGDSLTLSGFQVAWDGCITWKARIAWCYEDGPRNSAAWTSKHEDCLFYAGPLHKLRTPKEPSIHKDPRWGDDRLMGDVWRVPRVLGNYGERDEHPTQKPLAVMCLPIQASTSEGQVVLDPFMGSGSTGVAAIQLGRKFIGIEREPKYFKLACRRIEQAYAQRPLFEAAPAPKAEQLTFEAP